MIQEGEGVEVRPVLYIRDKEVTQKQVGEVQHALQISVLTNQDCSSVPEALKLCAEKGWTHLICLSNPVQKKSAKWPEFQKLILERPWDIHCLVSPPAAKEKNHPLVQRLLDIGENDFRQYRSENVIYPVFLVQDFIGAKNDSFIFDRILIDCIRKRRSLHKVPFAMDPGIPVKGFWNKLWRSHYEGLLIALTSFENGTRPFHSALSLAMGVFFGCSPFYGLQTFLIISAALIFRLSFPVAFLGSQISLPPIYSLIVPLELYVGFSFTKTPFDFDGPLLVLAQTHFLSWLIGATLVGLVVAIALGTLWFFIQKSYQQKAVAWNGQMRGGKLGNAIMFRLIRWGGLPLAYFLLYFIVPYFYFFAPTARRGLAQYYSIIRPSARWFNRQFLILRHLYRFAQTIVDQAFQAAHTDVVFDINYESGDTLKPGYSQGASIMMFSHFGGWGLTTQRFSRHQKGRKIHAIKYVSEQLTSEKIFKEKKSDALEKIEIKPGQPLYMRLHQILGNGERLAIMGDRPFDNNFELVPFMGRLAPIPNTPFRIAKTYNAELSFIMGYKKTMKTYGLITESHDLSNADQKMAMNQYVSFLESCIKKHPDQWFNHYSFWSTIPTRPDGSLCEPTRYQWVGLRTDPHTLSAPLGTLKKLPSRLDE